MSVCQVKAGDKVEVKISCSANDKGSITMTAGILDEQLFRQAYDNLNASTLELTEFKNTQVAGTIHCNRDGVLYTSIPQDGNWTATVDGKPAEIVTVCGAMVGIQLSEGEHTITFTYRNRSHTIGWIVTLCSFAAFLALYYFFYKPDMSKAKKLWFKLRNRLKK